jgi:hypothetical protein
MLGIEEPSFRSRKSILTDGPAPSPIGSGRRFSTAATGPATLSVAAVAAGVLFVGGMLVFKYLEALSWTDAAFAATGVVSSVGVVVRPTSALSRAFIALLNAASMTVGAVAIAELAEVQKRIQLRRSGVTELGALVATAVPLLLLGAVVFAW